MEKTEENREKKGCTVLVLVCFLYAGRPSLSHLLMSF